MTNSKPVLLCSEIAASTLEKILAAYNLVLCQVAADADIPGSYWQPPEAGLISNRLYIRPDTPVHSALHEACHYICMPQSRRAEVDTNAGGDYEEENAVCYLQILLAEKIPEMQQMRMFEDMDAWGYSFRLGSARAWFEQDAEDAHLWLLNHCIIDASGEPTAKLRID